MRKVLAATVGLIAAIPAMLRLSRSPGLPRTEEQRTLRDEQRRKAGEWKIPRAEAKRARRRQRRLMEGR